MGDGEEDGAGDGDAAGDGPGPPPTGGPVGALGEAPPQAQTMHRTGIAKAVLTEKRVRMPGRTPSRRGVFPGGDRIPGHIQDPSPCLRLFAAREFLILGGMAAAGDQAAGDHVLPLILLADDTEDNRDLYGMVLSMAGWRVEFAVDGQEAVDKATSRQPALVVMDLGMPVMDGWQATEIIKAQPETRHIPIIALSGHVTTESRLRALAAGAAAFCSKPCAPRALVDAVRQHLLAAARD